MESEKKKVSRSRDIGLSSDETVSSNSNLPQNRLKTGKPPWLAANEQKGGQKVYREILVVVQNARKYCKRRLKPN